MTSSATAAAPASGTRPTSSDIPHHRGFAAFAPLQPARGARLGSAARAGRPEDTAAPVLTEDDLY
ncbi:hypothetical protein L083_2823 [Actinoplanes sp. N902-109]|nr:hypothetical protein L083_2823 [Actinoplanes sp. N902-109]